MTLQTEGLQTLEQIRFGYDRLGKADKVLVSRYPCKVMGHSRAQMNRLIARFRRTGRIKDRRGAPGRTFLHRYTREDVLLLAEDDSLSTAAPSRARYPKAL